MRKEVIFDCTDELTEDDLRALFEEEDLENSDNQISCTAAELKEIMKNLKPGMSITVYPEDTYNE